MKTIEHFNLRSSIEKGTGERRAVDNDFYIFEVNCSPSPDYPFKIDDYGCCICLRGTAEGYIDFTPQRLSRSYMSVNVPGQLIEMSSMSKDFHGIGIVMSKAFVQSLNLPYDFRLDRLLRSCPVLQLEAKQQEAILTFFGMINRLLETDRPFQRETLKHLTCALFYGIGSYLFQISSTRHYTTEETLMQRFLAEVKTNYRKHRKVAFYAERLHISTGYMSSVVKRVSGKSPGGWIDDFVVGEARALLKGSSLTVQQISIELGFPSQSFFGKYFKRITGYSPVAYRENTVRKR